MCFPILWFFVVCFPNLRFPVLLYRWLCHLWNGQSDILLCFVINYAFLYCFFVISSVLSANDRHRYWLENMRYNMLLCNIVFCFFLFYSFFYSLAIKPTTIPTIFCLHNKWHKFIFILFYLVLFCVVMSYAMLWLMPPIIQTDSRYIVVKCFLSLQIRFPTPSELHIFA